MTLTLTGALGSDRTRCRRSTREAMRFFAVLLNSNRTVTGAWCRRQTFKWTKKVSSGQPTPSNKSLRIYQMPNTGTSKSTITKAKFERGGISTDWCPAFEDFQPVI